VSGTPKRAAEALREAGGRVVNKFEYERRLSGYEAEMAELREQAKAMEEEIVALRRRLQDAPKRVRTLEERLLDTKGQLAQAVAQNEKLSYTLREAREQIAALREEVEKLTRPPSAYGTYLGHNPDDGTVDVFSGGRKMRVALHPDIDAEEMQRGAEVVLNESLNVVLARGGERQGEVVTLKEVLDDGERALIVGRADEERVAELGDSLKGERLRSGDTLLMDVRSGLLLEKLPRPEVEDLVLEEVPDVSYADVGGLDDQIEQITDAVELPFVHRELFAEYRLPAPKGILLYGPPGCGKTLIAKAVANSLAKKVAEVTGDEKARSYFLNIKGPELLNKYVGETERQIRLVFQRPDESSAAQIFSRYLTVDLPLDGDEVKRFGSGDKAKAIDKMIEITVAEMYRADEANQFLEVTYQNGDREVMYFKDFSSGAMIENIVRRAKKLAIKRLIAGGSPGVGSDDLRAAILQEYKEHEDLPNTTNPDDWAKISGKKGERIVYVRTLVGNRKEAAGPTGGRSIERVATGQYL
jgi:ATP-dependent 26S proteasome regulatory subunit